MVPETGADVRRLLLIRHAQAEAHAASDRHRHLTPRGVVDARALGEHLATAVPGVDHAYVSAASRTRQTWRHIAVAAEWEPAAAEVLDALYSAGPRGVLEFAWGSPEAASTVAVVGHNPTISMTALELADPDHSDPTSLGGLGSGMSTASVAVFEVTGRWADLAPATARLVGFHIARG